MTKWETPVTSEIFGLLQYRGEDLQEEVVGDAMPLSGGLDGNREYHRTGHVPSHERRRAGRRQIARRLPRRDNSDVGVDLLALTVIGRVWEHLLLSPAADSAQS